jgi:hypothetical protein
VIRDEKTGVVPVFKTEKNLMIENCFSIVNRFDFL